MLDERPKMNFTTLNPKDQREITNNWNIQVPFMARLDSKPMNLYRRIGPFLVCLKLKKDSRSTSYEPMLLCQNLAVRLNHFSDIPISKYGIPETLCIEARGDFNGHSLSWITNETHHAVYKESYDSLKANSTFQLKEKVNLKDIISAYQTYILTTRKIISAEIYDQALIAAWAGDLSLTKSCIAWAKENQDKGNIWSIKKLYGATNWIADLEQRCSDIEQLRTTVAETVVHQRLEKLPYTEIDI